MDKGTVKDISFYSECLQENMQLLIYIPANYTPLYRYNILIASDGKDYFQLGGIPRLADELIDDYEIEHLIIVGVPYKSIADRKRKYIPSGDHHEAYLRFLAHELVPYLDQEFSTNALGACRGLIGDSMAATVSLLAAVKYPHVFGKAILHSPYVDDLVMEKVRTAKGFDQLSIYHVIGTDENEVILHDKTVKDFLTPNREMHKLMVEMGYETFYEEFKGNHNWKYWKPDLKRALIENFG